MRVAPGVEGILQQLFDHRRRPVDHFAGRDLVGHLVGQYVDTAHVSHHLPKTSRDKRLCHPQPDSSLSRFPKLPTGAVIRGPDKNRQIS